MTSTSAETDAGAMKALQELLDERQRYEGWLRTLEQRKGATAPHVYGRVYSDYTARLERVLQRLSERTEQLQSSIEVMTSRLNTLRAREADRIDAREEAELRAAVGEYADEEWATLRDDADREIAGIAEERRHVEGEVAELQRIVELTRHHPTVVDGAAPPAEELSSQLSLAVPPEQEAAPAPSVPPPPPAPQRTPPPPPVEALDEAMTPIPVREQEKTLKCPECGTMNYATEWYCERCGGELATF